jgi:hypothetical protein
VKRGLIIALIVGCSLGVWKVIRERGQGAPSFTTVEEFIGFASQSAVTDARTYDHIDLDYSVDSLKQVDQILGRVHDTCIKNHPRSICVDWRLSTGHMSGR